MSDASYPASLRYSSEHEWVSWDGQVARVGITHFAQDSLGDVVFVTAPAVGDSVAAGESCGEIESTKSVSDLYAPLSGEVTAVNEALDTAPEAVNTDPYGAGWIYEMTPSDPDAIDSLMDAQAYEASLT